MSFVEGGKRQLSGGQESETHYPLPWPVLTRRQQTEPWLHRLAGTYMLKSLITGQTGGKFSTSEFLEGAKNAIETIVEALPTPDKLENLVHPRIHKAISDSFRLAHTPALEMEIDTIDELRLSGVNFVGGVARDPNERHVVAWMGQKLLINKSRLEEIVSDNKRFDTRLAKEIGKEAALTRMVFFLSVSFRMRERYVLRDVANGNVLQNSNGFKTGFHFWRFGSEVLWDEPYPFQWRIYDINRYLESCDPLYYE